MDLFIDVMKNTVKSNFYQFTKKKKKKKDGKEHLFFVV
jgi:hypothetical protein